MPSYIAEGKFATEEEAKTDLDTCGYFGKWNKAKVSVAAEQGYTPDSPAYWDAVRLYFLELGGCWMEEKPEPCAESAPRRAFPIIPQLPYHEPQKVRFA